MPPLRIEANGLEFSCSVDGPADAPAVVFVHGLAASSRIWQGQAQRLRDRYRVVRYDLRSHGESQACDAPCTRDDLARDLLAILDRLALDRAFVVGHSAGGVIAMHAALLRPERIAGLVLVGTASECNDKTAAWYEKTAAVAREQGGAEAVKAMGLRADAARAPDGAGFAHLALAMRTLNREPLTAKLAALNLPALIVVGEKDFLGVGGSVILSRAIAGSELEIVPQRGHGIYLEDPDWFAARLDRFFARVLASP
jgi:pimeloyl-ACP methyl ester carboxylesterase